MISRARSDAPACYRWPMKAAVALMMLATTGCATVFNGGTATVVPAPGVLVNGSNQVQLVDKQGVQVVQYANGQGCYIDNHISAGWIVVDIVLTGFLGLVVDAVTGDWKNLDSTACPGVLVQN